jgi:hypothetical protein
MAGESMLPQKFEARRWPIASDERFDPIDVLDYAIEELGHTQRELAELLGSRSRAFYPLDTSKGCSNVGHQRVDF